jgi:hypothetical protein
VNLSIHFRNGTVKVFTWRWEEAYRRGNARLVRRTTASLDIAQNIPVETIAQRLCISETSVYRWLHAFLLDGYQQLRLFRARFSLLTRGTIEFMHNKSLDSIWTFVSIVRLFPLRKGCQVLRLPGL